VSLEDARGTRISSELTERGRVLLAAVAAQGIAA